MAGASGSGQEMQTGRTNRAEGRTKLWAQVPPGQSNFNGPAILMLEVAKDAEDPDDYEDGENFVPSNHFHGLVATGWSGGGAGNFGGTPGASGVIGRGGRNQGSGVVGLGGGTPEPGNGGAGGIGVHGLGGPQADFFADPGTPPGAGVVAQGGRQSDNDNQERLPHAAGVIGIAGGKGRNKDLISSHPLTATGGVYAQGAEATVNMVTPLDAEGNSTSGPNVPSGPPAPGTGVLGRGGVPVPRKGPVAAGVIGLAGDTEIPVVSETGDAGVYGRGPVGVHGHGETSRGGVFDTRDQPQMRLVPLEIETPSQLRGPAQAGDFLVTTQRDERGQEVASLWFCTVASEALLLRVAGRSSRSRLEEETRNREENQEELWTNLQST